MAPTDALLQQELALCLLGADRVGEALEAARQAASLEPANVDFQSLLGRIAVRAGDIDTGKAAFLSAAALAPQDPWFLRELAHCLSLRGHFDDAVRYMRQAVDLKPDIPENNAILAHLLGMSGRIPDAETFLRRAIALAPDRLEYRKNLAHNLAWQRREGATEYTPVLDEEGHHKVLVGKDGWLFLNKDSNRTLDQYRGDYPLNDCQMESWRQELQWRREFFATHDICHILLIAPNKECVYDNFLPDDIQAGSVRPVHQFLRMARDIVPTSYPLDALRKLRDDVAVFDKVDTHWTVLGALVACMDLNEVHERTYASPAADFRMDADAFFRSRSTGDLGRKFMPERTAECVILAPWKQRAILESDNGVSNHGGISVYRNASGNRKKCLIFGDSFGRNVMEIVKEYFTATVFCHSSLIDARMVAAEKPDLVISEHVERFLVAPPGLSERYNINDVISEKRKSVAGQDRN